MSLPCNWTYEQTSQVLNRIKEPEFEVEGGRLEIIPEERYKEVFTIMSDHFAPDEPLGSAFGVKWNNIYESVVLKHLKENVSLMMVSEKTNEIMGVRISGTVKKTDDISEILTLCDEPIKNLVNFLTQKDKEINFYERFGVDEAIHFFALGVNRNYRRLGLGTKLMGAAIALTRELGFKVIKGEGTSAFSQRIYQKCGFEVLCELPYDMYTINGNTLRDRTGVHAMTKIVALKL